MTLAEAFSLQREAPSVRALTRTAGNSRRVVPSVLRKVVPPEGFEPSTSRSGGARSNPLSYEGNG